MLLIRRGLRQLPFLHLQVASQADEESLIHISQQCFSNTIAMEMRERLKVSQKGVHRQIYLANTADNKRIGMLHVRQDPTKIVLHDIGIVPSHQKQGYGRSLVVNWLHSYRNVSSKPIVVEVYNTHLAALALYQACGFEQGNAYEILEVSLSTLSYYLR